MRHISACDRCYDTFILGVEIREDMGKKRNVVFRPLALAASVLLVVLSIVIIYKSGISPKKEELAYPAPETIEESRPESMPKKGEAAFKAAGDKEEVPPPAKARPQPRAKQVTGKETDSRDASKYGEDQAMRSRTRAVGGTKKAAGREVEKRAGQRLKAPPPEAAQVAVGVTQEQKALHHLEEEAAEAEGDDPTWQEVDRLNLRQFPHRQYIPPEQQKSLFNEAINLTHKLGGELSVTQKQARQKQDYRQLQNYQRRAGPYLNVVVQKDANYVSPNVGYFQQRSKPGSSEYRFYELARFGWYYKGTWYGGGDHKETDRVDTTTAKTSDMAPQPQYSTRALLRKWQKLRPQLSGIFRQIADQTIEYLKGQSTQDR
jgi:hypothetical protein